MSHHLRDVEDKLITRSGVRIKINTDCKTINLNELT